MAWLAEQAIAGAVAGGTAAAVAEATAQTASSLGGDCHAYDAGKMGRAIGNGMIGGALMGPVFGWLADFALPSYFAARYAPAAAETTVAPRFLVTESGVAVPTEAAELRANMQLLQDASTSPSTARKFLGTDSQGPLRVRIEQAHPSTPGYTGPIDPLHTVDHLHIDRRLNGTTGPWQSNEKLPYGWPF
jgi:hypothetical protein